jgi:hypothetical protein
MKNKRPIEYRFRTRFFSENLREENVVIFVPSVELIDDDDDFPSESIKYITRRKDE